MCASEIFKTERTCEKAAANVVKPDSSSENGKSFVPFLSGRGEGATVHCQ